MATVNQSVPELKHEIVMEAANDPNSSVTSADAQAHMVQESKKAGVPAFSFNPDASPEEKKAQVRAVRVYTCANYLSTLLSRPLI